MSARPLHKQTMLGRRIVITEQADLHLLWRGPQIFLKPLPVFLMDRGFWQQYLCRDEDVHKRACGYLLSYIWLVCHESDFRIAKSHGLLPDWVQWVDWVALTRSFLDVIDYDRLMGVDRRYLYGELRLGRINWIYRLTGRGFIRGYLYGYNQYSVFLRDNFAWLAVVFLYITVVLSAMQVGLATQRLNDHSMFQNASASFTIFAMLAPLIITSIAVYIIFVLFSFNFYKTLSYKAKVEAYRRTRQEKISGSTS